MCSHNLSYSYITIFFSFQKDQVSCKLTFKLMFSNRNRFKPSLKKKKKKKKEVVVMNKTIH